ncbi:unnamed protein product [Rotaria sp. Silwood2]|nr:unnamed protein product [Rotaria sp. Silwood2]CAF2527396.1 unnamed protein product [Rotaria sp. Silwood2]CAF2784374.1 unnamed protein product [Rotaria sp. Silwood2]CAF2937020.1 unnamed protein product [Rotaria sp. Silwood2]CAF3866096.1 unnamed protein product [Rotaria sp. Silwood2]
MDGDYNLQVRRKNCRLLIFDSEDSGTLDPIIGYAQEPLVTLLEACQPLVTILHDIFDYARDALEHTPDNPPDYLSRDESASIRLYTKEWRDEQKSLYIILNETLNQSDREKLRPWFKYLKLFLTGVVKIPCAPQQTIWRGVRKDVSNEHPPGTTVTWWGFSSCTRNISVLKSNVYLGDEGTRTLFSIEAFNARDIQAHSYFNREEEVLLLPGTYLEVQEQLNPASDLYIIHLKQMIPKHMLLELPSEGMLNN